MLAADRRRRGNARSHGRRVRCGRHQGVRWAADERNPSGPARSSGDGSSGRTTSSSSSAFWSRTSTCRAPGAGRSTSRRCRSSSASSTRQWTGETRSARSGAELELRTVRDGLEYGISRCSRIACGRSRPTTRASSPPFTRRPRRTSPFSRSTTTSSRTTCCPRSPREGRLALPDYCCDIATDAYRQADKFGRLIKLHGSLNWLYCPNCYRLDLGVAQSGLRTVKVLNQLYLDHLDGKYGCHGSPCGECGTFVRPVLITPTHLKDYRNPHIARIWYSAARALREAKRVIFIGYSMPDDDIEVVYLFKRGLAHLKPRDITVVEQAGKGNRRARRQSGRPTVPRALRRADRLVAARLRALDRACGRQRLRSGAEASPSANGGARGA